MSKIESYSLERSLLGVRFVENTEDLIGGSKRRIEKSISGDILEVIQIDTLLDRTGERQITREFGFGENQEGPFILHEEAISVRQKKNGVSKEINFHYDPEYMEIPDIELAISFRCSGQDFFTCRFSYGDGILLSISGEKEGTDDLITVSFVKEEDGMQSVDVQIVGPYVCYIQRDTKNHTVFFSVKDAVSGEVFPFKVREDIYPEIGKLYSTASRPDATSWMGGMASFDHLVGLVETQEVKNIA